MADSAEAAEVMRTQREIKRALQAAEAAQIALLGIGNLDPAQSGYVKGGFMTAEDLMRLSAVGAVGDIAGRIFTVDGQRHENTFEARIIGVGYEELKNIPITIAVAMGLEKTRAIFGALRTGIINVLCTDDRTASAVLGMERRNGS
jgi:DNA-binding transcriptional regulator LsrR (DeoR family)